MCFEQTFTVFIMNNYFFNLYSRYKRYKDVLYVSCYKVLKAKVMRQYCLRLTVNYFGVETKVW